MMALASTMQKSRSDFSTWQTEPERISKLTAKPGSDYTTFVSVAIVTVSDNATLTVVLWTRNKTTCCFLTNHR